MASAEYYVLIGDKEEGPFSLEQLKAMLASGKIPRDAKVSAHGWKEWLEAQFVLGAHIPFEFPTVERTKVDFGINVPPVQLLAILACILISGGVAALGYLWFLYEPHLDGSDVVNLMRLSDRQNGMMCALVAILVGTIIAATLALRPASTPPKS